MKILPVGAELFHADRRTDRHVGANGSFFEILRTRRQKEEKSINSRSSGSVRRLLEYEDVRLRLSEWDLCNQFDCIWRMSATGTVHLANEERR